MSRVVIPFRAKLVVVVVRGNKEALATLGVMPVLRKMTLLLLTTKLMCD